MMIQNDAGYLAEVSDLSGARDFFLNNASGACLCRSGTITKIARTYQVAEDFFKEPVCRRCDGKGTIFMNYDRGNKIVEDCPVCTGKAPMENIV